MKISYHFFLLIVVILGGFTSPVIADSNYKPSYYQANDQQDSISEQAAVAIARKQINGRVLAISRENNVYRIKILSDQSTVHIVAVDAINGMVKSSH